MSRILRIAGALIACLAADASVVSAQDRPVIFLHGFDLNLSGPNNTWQEAADALQQQLALEAHRTTTNATNQVGIQAAEVQNALGFLPTSTVAVAHSNGGLVAREWSRIHPLGGLVTIGTPNSGLPLVENINRWIDFNDEVFFRFSDLFDAFTQCQNGPCTWSIVSEVLYGQGLNELMSILSGWFSDGWKSVISTLGFILIDGTWFQTDIIPQVASDSSFITNLNATVGSEATTGARVGIVTVTTNYDKAGYWRIFKPEQADTVYLIVGTVAWLTNAGAQYIYSTVDPADTRALRVADYLQSASNILYSADWWWCRALSSPSFADECWANDTLVPTWSQALPNSVVLPHGGPAHIQETKQSNAKLFEALTNFMAIPPRPGGGGPMQANSAVRGCSNWTWLDPVYMPDANACYSYCQQSGASACEWASQADGGSNAGDCYAEFGSGCSVESGHSPWYAAVLSSTPPQPPAGQMQANSAVRGCSNWSWWDPVNMPSAAACAQYCVDNGAHACEWASQADGASNAGDCYVEFGSGCYVEAGYSGWYALVLQ